MNTTKNTYKVKDFTGCRFGRLLVLKEEAHSITPGGQKKRRVLCKCDCGNQKIIRLSNLGRNHTNSCGCFHRDVMQSHGMSATSTYGSWESMKARCFNKKLREYKNYGGRGITVCDRWMKFENFFADMGERPLGKTIDRKNNNGNYCPENCRWATKMEQADNTRRTKSLKYKGETLTLSQWGRRLNMNRATIYARIRMGWSAERTLTTP